MVHSCNFSVTPFHHFQNRSFIKSTPLYLRFNLFLYILLFLPETSLFPYPPEHLVLVHFLIDLLCRSSCPMTLTYHHPPLTCKVRTSTLFTDPTSPTPTPSPTGFTPTTSKDPYRFGSLTTPSQLLPLRFQ